MNRTSIEWTDRTVNPIRARNRQTGQLGHYCEKISGGCAKCYASTFQPRFGLPKFEPAGRLETLPVFDDRGNVIINAGVEVFLDNERLQQVLRIKEPQKIFWCDMTDLIGSWVPDEWIDHCFATMVLTPQHTHQVLTKRPARMAEYMQRLADSVQHWDAGEGETEDFLLTSWIDSENVEPWIRKLCIQWLETYNARNAGWPLPNVILGTSVENQATADHRREHLAAVAAAGWRTFASYEPALGPVDWTGWEWLDWIVSGGESGGGARPHDPQWHRDTLHFCLRHDIPFLFKQWGHWRPTRRKDDVSRAVLMGDTMMVPIGKKHSGRELDRVEHNGFPQMGVALR